MDNILNRFSTLLRKQVTKKKNLIFILPSVIILQLPVIFSRYPYSRINNEVIEHTYNLFNSKEIQEYGYSISTKVFSRKDSADLKLKLLSKIDKPKKDIILIANHQLQHITKKLNNVSIFNLWIGNYGITEIADIVSYMDKYDDSMLPNKILITGVTTPNNDNGGCIVGYRDELPDYIYGISRNPYVFTKGKIYFTPGSMISQAFPIRKLRYSFDFKNLWGFLRTELLGINPINDISVTNSLSIKGDFAFDKTGATTGAHQSLVFDEQDFKGDPSMSYSDIDEIVYSLIHIDEIASRRGIKHILLIPPVYESTEPGRMNSYVNKVLDEALTKFKASSKSTLVIDHRRESRFLDFKNSSYYYHYDHPSPLYGLEFFREALKIAY